MVIDQIVQVAPKGTVIPKPKARGKFVVVGVGRRRGERALIYSIPNHVDPKSPYKKGITESEFEKSFKQLCSAGELTRKWFKKNLTACDMEGSCNFTTAGGLFVLLGKAKYLARGVYQKI